MTHTENISFKTFTSSADGYGGQTTPTAATDANGVSWGTVEEVRSTELVEADRLNDQKRYRVTCNWRSGWTPTVGMLVVTRFGDLSIISVRETERKRTWVLEAVIKL
jgi:uncharacterized DUF497 family protein